MPRTFDVQIAEGTVRVWVIGEGRPVLFLHGLGARGLAWHAVARHFAATRPGWACWVPDLLGRGDSPAPRGLSFGLSDEVRRLRQIVRVLDPAGGMPRLIAGHSQGAAIALALARVETGVRGLLLSNPVGAGIRRPLALTALRWAGVRRAAGAALAPLHGPAGRLVLRRASGPAFRPPPGLAAAYSRPWASPARAPTLMRLLADWRPRELRAHMPARRLEVHVTTGGLDRRIPVATARRLAARLGCPFTLMPDGGHVLPEQHPRAVSHLLAGLADRVTASAASPPSAPGTSPPCPRS